MSVGLRNRVSWVSLLDSQGLERENRQLMFSFTYHKCTVAVPLLVFVISTRYIFRIELLINEFELRINRTQSGISDHLKI